MAVSEMAMQPLWIDVSSWQGILNFNTIASLSGFNKVHGIFSRAGWGQDGGYIDQTFERNWTETKRLGIYRSSYWAYWDYFPLQHQLDLWFRANPTIDFIPRMWDMEKEDAHPEFLSEQSWIASEQVHQRDGKRFIIYSTEAILERTLCKYWTPEQLNMHYFLLAQYDFSTPENPLESNGFRLPDFINAENVLWKQTSSDFALYQNSGPVDRDRWIWTDVETMHDDLQNLWGGGVPTPTPEPCCEELEGIITTIQSNQNSFSNALSDTADILNTHTGKFETIRTDIDSIEVLSNDNHTRLGATRTDLSNLEEKVGGLEAKDVQLERGVGGNSTEISRIMKSMDEFSSEIKTTKQELDELNKALDDLSAEIKAELNKIKSKLNFWSFLKDIFNKE